MRTSRGALVGAIALGFLAVAPATPAVAAPPTAPYNAFSLAGRWDAVGTPENTTRFSLQSRGDQGFMLDMDQAGLHYNMIIAAPTGDTLRVGTFPTTRIGNTTHASLDVTGPGFGCNEAEGSITIHEISRDTATGDITSIAVSYQQITCNTVSGEFRWNSAVGYTAATSTKRWVGFGNIGAGERSQVETVTFRSLGSSNVVLGAAAITGSNPDSFTITEDGCSGATLAYDQTCSVSVVTRPQAIGELGADLEFSSNTVGGKESVHLAVNAVKSNLGTFYPLAPQRLLDTREGNGAPRGPVGPGKVINLQVTGRGGVPATGAAIVVLNVTVVAPTGHGHVTVWPTGVAMPVASSLNFTPGWVGANSVTVAVGAGGQVSLFNSLGNTHLVADVVGWYADSSTGTSPGGLLHNFEPERWFDTRDQGVKLPGGHFVQLLTNFGAEVTPHVKAWVVNVTVTAPSAGGYLTAWDGNEFSLPATSTLNYATGQTVSNFAIVPAGRCWDCTGEWYGASMIGIYVQATTHVIVDLFGVFDDGTFTEGLRLRPMTPTRIADSRSGQGIPAALGSASTAKVVTPSELLDEHTSALALNVTAVAPTAGTFVTVWPHGMPQPGVSNLNPARGQIVPNAVITELGIDNAFNVYNNGGSTHLVIDVVGTYFWYPFGAQAAGKPAGVDARTGALPDLNPRKTSSIRRH